MVQLTSTAGQETAPAGPGPCDGHLMAGLRADTTDLAARLGLAESAASAVAGQDWLRSGAVAVPADRLGRLAPGLAPRLDRIGSLQAEYETVRRYRDALAVLLPVEPELSQLSERDLARLGWPPSSWFSTRRTPISSAPSATRCAQPSVTASA